MPAYCENCGLIDLYTIGPEVMESMDIDGIKFECLQRHAYCAKCSREIWPNDMADENTNNAHLAYCKAAGIQPVDRKRRDAWNYLSNKIYECELKILNDGLPENRGHTLSPKEWDLYNALAQEIDEEEI